jgi:hypothetical protein
MHPPIVEFLSAPYATREDFSFIGNLIDAIASRMKSFVIGRRGSRQLRSEYNGDNHAQFDKESRDCDGLDEWYWARLRMRFRPCGANIERLESNP